MLLLALIAVAARLIPAAAPYMVCPDGCRYTTIQAAIDAARPGDTITVGPGEYGERLVITKPLLVEGHRDQAGDFPRVMTRGPVLIEAAEPITVDIVGLRFDGDYTRERPSACAAAATCPYGMIIAGHARVTLKGVELINHVGSGLWVREAGAVTLDGGSIDRSPTGLRATDTATVTGKGASIRVFALEGGGQAGLVAADRARVTLVATTISTGVEAGVAARGAAEVELRESRIVGWLSDGPGHGVVVGEQARVALRQVVIQGNYAGQLTTLTGKWCQQQGLPTQVCVGILLTDQARLTLFNVKVTDHTDWGLAARLRQCGFEADDFSGQVIVEGPLTFLGNNSAGRLIGRGNPGDHPWRAAGLADGQVCLP